MRHLIITEFVLLLLRVFYHLEKGLLKNCLYAKCAGPYSYISLSLLCGAHRQAEKLAQIYFTFSLFPPPLNRHTQHKFFAWIFFLFRSHFNGDFFVEWYLCFVTSIHLFVYRGIIMVVLSFYGAKLAMASKQMANNTWDLRELGHHVKNENTFVYSFDEIFWFVYLVF